MTATTKINVFREPVRVRSPLSHAELTVFRSFRKVGNGSMERSATGIDPRMRRGSGLEPHRVYRRPHFLRDWGHHDETGITEILP